MSKGYTKKENEQKERENPITEAAAGGWGGEHTWLSPGLALTLTGHGG